MRDMEQVRRTSDVDLVVRWGTAAIVAVGLLTAGYTFIHYAAELDKARTLLGARLPSDYRETIVALVQSARGTCRTICDIAPAGAGRERTTFSVTCGVDTGADACRTTRRYTLTIAPAPRPSR